jgi:hypothetical protein
MDEQGSKELGQPEPRSDRWGAIGAGIVLVLLPSMALFFGTDHLEKHGSIGLPVVAIFGVIVLVGALALTSTLFKRLKLTSRKEPLALPPGSVRATMALALIVLFAIIAVSAMRPPHELKTLNEVSGTALAELKRDPRISVLQAVRERCLAAPATTTAASSSTKAGSDSLIALPTPPSTPPVVATAPPACPSADERYSVLVKVGPDGGQQDLVKQLVLTIGQLMTMAVSFYFAGRSAVEAKTGADGAGGGSAGGSQPLVPNPPPPPVAESRNGTVDTGPAPPPRPDAPSPSARAAAGPGPRAGTTFDVGGPAADGAADHDGCAAPGLRATDDVDLPEAQGGIRNP